MNNVRRLKLGVVLALAAMAAGAVFASSAVAFPTKTSPCSGCHDGVNVPVTATLKSVTAAAATYSVSAPSADAIAVFSGSTRLFVFSATSAQFSVAPGKTYSIQAVAGPGTSDGWGSTSVSPVAPVTDTTAPVTTSDAKATYVSSAAIKLTAADNAGGSGVAATYYKLDGGAQVTGTSIATTVLGSHTIEFWSADVAGNIETPHKTAAFTDHRPGPGRHHRPRHHVRRQGDLRQQRRDQADRHRRRFRRGRDVLSARRRSPTHRYCRQRDHSRSAHASVLVGRHGG